MLISVLAAVVVGAAFLVPGSWLSVALGWVAAGLIVAQARSSVRLYRRLFLFGVVLHAIGFYWLPETLAFFGGFPQPVAFLFFGLYLAVSSVQFVFFGWLLLRLKQTRLDELHLALPLAWFAAEFLVPRLFPWALSNTQIAWSGFASLAEASGTIPLAIVMLWIAGWLIAAVERKRRSDSFFKQAEVLIATVMFLFIGLGQLRAAEIGRMISASVKIKAGLIQGNLDVKDKRDVYQLETNLAQHAELSAQAAGDGAEVLFWPESVVPVWIAENRATVAGTQFAPFLDLGLPLIFGGLMYRQSDWTKPPKAPDQVLKQFNSAVLIDRNRNIQGRYHKRVLMPFGEYMPFADLIPAIKEISPNTGEFSAGDRSEPFQIEKHLSDGTVRPVKISMLICYEDLVPWMTREAVNNGADILAAVTNDAWYGKTAAPHEHNLLAAWRSIETRRALLRVTNTGLTAMISPLGETVEPLPIFTRGYRVASVPLLSIKTIYSVAGDIPAWTVSAGIFLAALLRGRNRKAAAKN